MIVFKHYGSFKNTERFLSRAKQLNLSKILDTYAQQGVSALASATPVDTGLTSVSWTYKVEVSSKGYSITWSNTNIVSGVSVAILLQYGHGTGTGGYVSGRDYINPAMRPVFDKIAEKIWEEVTKL